MAKAYWFLINPKSVDKDALSGVVGKLSDFEAFQKEKVGDFIGMAKNDIAELLKQEPVV